MEKNKFEEMVDNLKKSPLYAISKCGIELAHSNFWKWMIEIEYYDGLRKINPFIEVFINNFYADGNEFISVEREKDNMDLLISFETIRGEKKFLIIENKIKSIPTLEQLEKYQIKVGDNFEKGIITGIINTLENTNEWEFLSYSEIAKRIDLILYNLNNLDNFTKNILQQYTKDLNHINDLVVGLNKPGLYQWDGEKILEEIKFNDIFKKFQGCKLAKEIVKKINNDKRKFVIESDWEICDPIVTFNHKNTTITTVYKSLTKEGKEKGRIGIQIEGKQFRIYGGPSISSSSLKNADNLYNKFIKIGFFGEVNVTQKDNKNSKDNNVQLLIKGHNSSMIKKYCKYQTETYTHIYQYWDIEDISIEKLSNQVINNLKIIKNIIENGLDFD